jgi:hypothetical protein
MSIIREVGHHCGHAGLPQIGEQGHLAGGD